MYFDDLKMRMRVQIAPAVIENQKDVLVLTDVTEAIVKCKNTEA